MDYEFKKNVLDGSYYCHCSMGHEILGRWVQEEIGKDQAKVREVLALLDQARANSAKEWSRTGPEISLLICGDEVTIQDNALLMAYDDQESEFELYDSESIACCGLEDFEQLMLQWLEFIQR